MCIMHISEILSRKEINKCWVKIECWDVVDPARCLRGWDKDKCGLPEAFFSIKKGQELS